jgi:hypothetical protein
LSESRFPDLLETLVVKVLDGIVGDKLRALQAGVASSIPATSTDHLSISQSLPIQLVERIGKEIAEG